MSTVDTENDKARVDDTERCMLTEQRRQNMEYREDNPKHQFSRPSPELMETFGRREFYKRHDPSLRNAVESLSSGEFQEAIAVALIVIAKKLDETASHLDNLVEIQRRIADSGESPPPESLTPYRFER